MTPEWRLEQPAETERADRLVGNHPCSGFMQSAFWSDFKRTEGYEVTRLIYADGDRMIGSASLLRFPHLSDAGFVLCPEGPVLPWEDTEVSRAGLRGLIEVVRQMPNTLGLRIEPHLPTPLPSVLRNTSNAPTDLTPADTLILDLSHSDDQLLAAAHPKCRYNLRVADRHGVKVSSHTDVSLVHDFYALLTETSNRTGFYVEPFGFFLNLVSTMFERGAGELFLSKYHGRTLAAILVVYFGRRATYLYGGSSSQDRQTMPAYPLHLAAIGSARRRGCMEYDMYGIDGSERRDHLYAGITRFKKQWGGTVCRRIGARDFVFYDRLADLVIDRLAEKPA